MILLRDLRLDLVGGAHGLVRLIDSSLVSEYAPHLLQKNIVRALATVAQLMQCPQSCDMMARNTGDSP